jgi:hypothetical protein
VNEIPVVLDGMGEKPGDLPDVNFSERLWAWDCARTGNGATNRTVRSSKRAIMGIERDNRIEIKEKDRLTSKQKPGRARPLPVRE